MRVFTQIFGPGAWLIAATVAIAAPSTVANYRDTSTVLSAAAAPTPTPSATPADCPVNFAGPANIGVGDAPVGIAVGDFNADGKADLVLGHQDISIVSLLLGNGAGGFNTPIAFAAGDQARSIAAGDFNRDGKLDVVVANYAPHTVSVLLGTGTGSFSAPVSYPTGGTSQFVAVGDFNADGKQDLAVALMSQDVVSILLGDGAGGFGAPLNLFTGDCPHAVVVGEFNGDGKEDLAVVNICSSNVVVMLGNGAGSFTSNTTLQPGSAPSCLLPGDFNGDGKQDLVVGHSSTVSLFLGNGSGGFSSAINFAAGDGVNAVAAGDFDADGNPDLAMANGAGPNISILLGDGAGHFGPPIDFLAGDGPGTVAVRDFNGDGKPDLSVANEISDDVSILLRDCTPRPVPILNRLVLSAPSFWWAGSSFSFQVKAKDQFNTTVTGYQGIVHFTATCAGSLPQDSPLPNGSGSFFASLRDSGSQRITATDTSDPSITGTSNPIFVSGSPTPTSTPTPSASPTASASPTPTASASPTPTASASPTPTASASPTPTASASPSPTGTISPPVSAQSLNLSSRLLVQTGDGVGIAGFIISGSEPKRVIVRAVHCQVCIPEVSPLVDPVLELHGSGGGAPIVNDNWSDSQEAEIIGTGLDPVNDSDSAIIVTLPPGNHTAVVRGKNNTSGVALVEVYDLDQAAASRLANISTRAFVSTGGDILIAGFILGNGTLPDNLIIRGIGPSLAGLGVANALVDPKLELRDSQGTLIRANNNWQDDPAQAALLNAADLAPANSVESGIAVSLSPGQYTALLEGANNGTGVGLVEVYDLGDK